MARAKYAALGAVAVAVIILVAAFLVPGASRPPGTAKPAPPFTVFTVDGEVISTNSSRGRVLLLDFSGIVCEPCRIVEIALRRLYAEYSERVTFLSVFIGGYGSNDNASIRSFRQTSESEGRPIPWHLAPDPTGNESLQLKYSVPTLPRLFVINETGYATRDWTPPIGFSSATVERDLSAALDSTLAGRGSPIDITAISIPALLVVAAFLSFFSPCSFPVLPAFMAYYLKEDAKGAKASNRVAAWRGFLSSLGIVTVYGIVFVVIAAIGVAAQGITKWLPPIIGVVLIVLAILSLLPFQYHFLTRPFIALKKGIAARFGGKWEAGLGTKLFAFGMGYGAAGFACVAPPFIGAVLNASALGSPEQAIFGLALYILIVIGLMVGITVALHVAGDRALQKVKAWSGAMKYISAVALIIAGSYLLWLFLIAYVFAG